VSILRQQVNELKDKRIESTIVENVGTRQTEKELSEILHITTHHPKYNLNKLKFLTESLKNRLLTYIIR
jgi:hypothetical protein